MVASDNTTKGADQIAAMSAPLETMEAKRANPTVKQLEELDQKYMKLEDEYQKKVAEIQEEYEKKQQPFLEQRREILAKKAPTETDLTKKTGTPLLPNFWLECLRNVPAIGEDIEEWDEPVLAYLKDIRREDLPDKSGLNNAGFKLVFEFAENEFFTNKELVRTYYTKKENDFVNETIIEKIVFDQGKIDWQPKKDVTVEVMQKKAKRGGGKKKAVQLKEEPKESFFRKFFRTIDPSDDENLDSLEDLVRFSLPEGEQPEEDEDFQEILDMLIDQAFDMGCCIRDNVISC